MRLAGRSSFVPLVVALLSVAASADAQPRLGPGREAEVASLFRAVGSGETSGWTVGDIAIRPDRIRAELHLPAGTTVVVELRHPAAAPSGASRTPSFAVVVLAGGADRGPPVARALAAGDDGAFWDRAAAAGTTSAAGFRFGHPLWLAGLAALALLLAGSLLRRRPWRDPAAWRTLLEVVALVAAAFIVRRVLFPSGPGNLRSHLPDPSSDPAELFPFGPGYGSWMRLWFVLAEADDRTAFLAGALAGALTVAPAYLLGWFGTGRRACGIAAGIALVVLPIHARLSPTDDSASLVGLLVATALACAVAAERLASRPLLVAGWLAAGLAATTRPEAALALVPLVALVLVQPGTRRLQLRPLDLLLAALVLVPTVWAAAVVAASAAATMSAGAGGPDLWSLARLLGAHGGSVLGPPHSPLPVGLLALLGLVVAARWTRGRALLWLAVALLPAVPTAKLAGPHLVTARYQAALLPVAAVLLGLGAVWLGERLLDRLPHLRDWLVRGGAAAAVGFLALASFDPAPEPTFRLEYAFFQEHLADVPRGCRLLRLRWDGDFGLEPPTHLSVLRGLDHDWVEAGDAPDPEDGCLVWWRPAACATVLPDRTGPAAACAALEARYRMEPLAEMWLPARPGFVETYDAERVRVGFYTLRRRNDAPASADTTSTSGQDQALGASSPAALQPQPPPPPPPSASPPSAAPSTSPGASASASARAASSPSSVPSGSPSAGASSPPSASGRASDSASASASSTSPPSASSPSASPPSASASAAGGGSTSIESRS
ncbi:MAG: glycosyltransferase family 39 protein [Deltaproteobacteria bacterium]|nr:glycosyltransferase family 39 protein [Deltaproteobacteria bacterium]